MPRRLAALLLLLLAFAAAADDRLGGGSGPATLPPHNGARAGGYRPLILFHDLFFGRTFVQPDYAFEVRARRARRHEGWQLVRFIPQRALAISLRAAQADARRSAPMRSRQDCSVDCELSWNMTREPEAAAGARWPRLRLCRSQRPALTEALGCLACAVWFHSVWTSRTAEFNAARRFPDALWVWAAAEAPSNWDRDVDSSAGLRPPPPLLDTLFNLSMTFQRDSDVAFPYGAAVAVPPRAHASAAAAAAKAHAEQLAAWFREKDKLVAWTVSHCWTASRREEYMARLRRVLDVDVYGKCAGPWGKLMGLGHEHHAELLRKEYKLYMALENRLCRDYITEKFWVDALLNDVIPVVRGGLSGADYAAVAPPGSYINVDDFASPEALAAHLREVGRNETLFASYHAWRVTHRLVIDSHVNWAHSKQAERGATCRLCELLHERHAQQLSELPRRQLNLTRFWSGATSCRTPTDVPAAHLLFQPTDDAARLPSDA